MSTNSYKIIKPSSPMYKNPQNKTIINECLFGEEIKILKKNNNWLLSQLLYDNYIGWINSNDVGYLPKENYKVSKIRTFIKKSPDIKAPEIHYLPFEAKIFVEEIINDWVKIRLSDFHPQHFGYVFKSDTKKIDSYKKDWVKVSETMINTPYRWGGRDTKGIDCSALLQLALQSSGVKIPRDTIDQEKISIFKDIQKEMINRGTIVFWKSHVGIMLDKKNIIHANAYHMSTKVELLEEVNKRINKEDLISFKCLEILS